MVYDVTTMIKKLILVIILVCVASAPAQAWRKWEYINPAHLQITITPDKPEIFAGDIATFTIRVRNRTDKPVYLDFATGQRFDLAGYHDRLQIFRWSQGLTWHRAPHSLSLVPGEDLTHKIAWKTTDRMGRPLPQGVYRAKGMLMVSPRHLVSNTCSFRLVPPEVKETEVVEARLNQYFNIEVPRFHDKLELNWHIDYVYNDNRISVERIAKTEDKTVITFHPKRAGHVTFHLYAFRLHSNLTESVERRTYRIEVK